jgi:hypothetical protein
MRPYKVFLAASCLLLLRRHTNFTCGITADSIRRLIGRLAASLTTLIAVSLDDLRHHRRLD